MNRRTFLKIASMGSVAFAAGCSANTEDNLFTMVQATEDMVTGRANWYASTCRECPAGCGVLAKNREGRVIKLEGNPYHPVNRGALCIRGQAALQGVYNPDRLTSPQIKTKDGWKTIAAYEAEALIREKADAAGKNGRERIAMFTETVGQTQLDLFSTVLEHFGGSAPVVFEPYGHEALKYAHARLFGSPILPSYLMDQADVLVGFGADFLETWLSPVEYARKFKAMHGYGEGQKGLFIQVSPFQSLTGANADRWIGCRPGTEAIVILGLIRRLTGDDSPRQVSRKLRGVLTELSKAYPPDAVARMSGVTPKDLDAIANRLLAAKRPLVLGTGSSTGSQAAIAAETAALLLNLALDPDLTLFDFDRRHRVEIAASRGQVLEAFASLADVELVLLNNVNPVFSIPGSNAITRVLSEKKRFVVAFSNFMDETAALADLIVPVQMALETWDTFESNPACLSTLQPAMGRTHFIPALGDMFLNLIPSDQRPAADYKTLVTQTVLEGSGNATASQWLKTIQQGGRFAESGRRGKTPRTDIKAASALVAACVETLPEPTDSPTLVVPPSVRFFDGRGANRPWLIETPDTITQIPWQTPALLHPEDMAAHDLADGDRVSLATSAGEIEAPAYAYAGLFPGTVAVFAGQGHTAFGRWASDQGVNPLSILDAAVDDDAGAPSFTIPLAGIKKGRRHEKLAITSGHRTALDRKIAPTVAIDRVGFRDEHAEHGLTMNSFPLTPPTPEGYDAKRDLYPPHDHAGYRWAMIVDMDRCIGCSACVAACYAENNIGIVGEERIIEGREMAWLQIQRYRDPDDMARMTFLPMMCQHCDNAPCEAVCPVYAPHHSKEGLNNQIYNRCIGTRFCAQNCPYKVRRFNWFDWKWPKPLDMQLNPWVTVRSKGVMEKCSFCIQRIKRAHNKAKNEKRAIRDGEVVPACAQTCPTGALTFGSLMDPDSRVSQLIKNPRAYQVMGYLNTKPAVIYLKKVVQAV